VKFDSTQSNNDQLSDDVLSAVINNSDLLIGDKVILTHGDLMETVGASNTLKVLTVNKKHM
jgi:pyruvate kinase